MTPLLLHLIFHPAAAHARNLALALHRALNADSALPNLAIPTRLLPEDGTGLPPEGYDLDDAERSVVIVLADDALAADPIDEIPAGRRAWSDFVADLKKRCDDARHRFLPVQLSAGAWPLHDDLRSTNFIRGTAASEEASRRLVERRLVVEISRFLMKRDRGERLPVKLFLSHAKQDIGQGPFDALTSHLAITQPVETWVDSAKIDPGSDFAAAIESGVRESAVLALVTAAYSSRPWCRREILFAKQHGRPLVVVDALHGIDIRAFPYLGNTPTISWAEGGAEGAVDLLLKEQLRHLHARLLLEAAKRPTDILIPVPPELSALVALPKGTTVLYPDPPLGDEETEILGKLEHEIETPLQRVGKTRSLANRRIALSISLPDSLARVGMFADHLDAALLEISRHLLARGCTLTYGGHLGNAGYTLRLFDLVLAHQQHSTLPPAERIVNYVGWPSTVTLEQRSKYKWQAVFKRTPMPDGVADLDPATFVPEPTRFKPDSPARRFAWARGMTSMREQQTADLHARIVLGGKIGPAETVAPDGTKNTAWYSGRIPGVAEEILLTLEAGKPLYLCGAFGGAAALATELLQGRVPEEFTWAFHKQAPHAEAMRELYARRGIAWRDYPAMASAFAATGVAGLAKANHLSEQENRELFTSRDLPRLIELLVTGLTRI
jgi:SLOG cluster2/TIR domain